MKKFLTATIFVSFFAFALLALPTSTSAQAQTCNPEGQVCTPSTAAGCSSANCSDLNIKIGTPDQGVDPNADVGDVLSNVITIIFVVAALAVLFMLIFGAFQWITSGGEKEAVGKARGRIVNALVGLAILAVAFLLVRVLAGIVHIDITNLTLPALDKPSTTTTTTP